MKTDEVTRHSNFSEITTACFHPADNALFQEKTAEEAVMGQAVVVLMAFFMTLGALDKALFNNRFGYGAEFEKGLGAMGSLTTVMMGIMCAAPALAPVVAPILTPLFRSIGSDPAMAAGMLLGVDSGGFPLARELTSDQAAVVLSGVGLGGTLGAVLTFALPLSLSLANEASRPYVAKGLVAAVAASPLSLLPVGWMTGVSFKAILLLGMPAFVLAAVLAVLLTLFRDPTVRAFLIFSRVLMGLFVLLLATAALQHYFPIVLIPGMDPIEPQLTIIGEIGLMLSGAFPLVLFIRRHLSSAVRSLARMLKTDEDAALGMVVSLANPLPMYVMANRMTNRGKVLCAAFSGPILTLLGDHLGYVTAVCPEAVMPLLVGKITAAVGALLLALLLEKRMPS